MRNRNEGSEYFENESRRIDKAIVDADNRRFQGSFSWVVAINDKWNQFFEKHNRKPNTLFCGIETWKDIRQEQQGTLNITTDKNKLTYQFMGLEIKIINAQSGYYVGLL
jgi:hypothetical protein